MTQVMLQRGHKRKTTLIYDPTQLQTNAAGEIITKKKKVAAYARVSTEQDAQQNSYEAQIEYYTDYIQKKTEWEFVKVYADEGISGTSYRNRDGFNEMVADAKAGKIDLILTKSISRFARNTVDSLVITRELKKYGVEIFFEKENISSMDTQAELIFTIMSSIAQEESRSISENVRWGMLRRMEAGQLIVPWKSFLGFECGPDGLPQIVEEEAVIVRGIYRDYLNGMGIRQIARKLTAKGIKSPRASNKWSPETIRNILSNEKYKGDAILQKTYTVDFLSKEVRVNHGERKQWYISDSHDAIVSPEAFRQVQAELKQRCNYKTARFRQSPFTYKLYCGKCGGFLGYRKWDLTKENVIDRWFCGPCYKKDPQADLVMLTERQIKKAFTEALRRISEQYEWTPDEYAQEFLPFINCEDKNKEALSSGLKDANPSAVPFSEHAWHTLLEYGKVMPDHTIVFKFRNGKKEIIAIG
ncbi:recombinase family protein [Candidatus Saccharibacteria bacterium]|nr:recombinase family protein [Candidatus Saccharibacteria bacterium]MBR6122495.1 recombinase family protein [Candidatus Saccharibacteria bacterium]